MGAIGHFSLPIENEAEFFLRPLRIPLRLCG